MQALQLDKWLVRLSDYVHVKPAKGVPDNVDGYAFFKRLNDKSNKERLARRRMRRHGESEAEALAYFSKPERRPSGKPVSDYPFISMTSLSSGSKYPVTVIREETDGLVAGAGFSTYGLSVARTDTEKDSSVPLFK